MKLLISIGPDLIGTTAYRSKAELRKELNRVAANIPIERPESLRTYVWDRPYSRLEILEAEIMTLNEHFEAVKLALEMEIKND